MDREKVIKGLECCFNPHSDNSCFCKCSDCPYDTDCHEWSAECQIQLNRDALALLKELQQQIWELQDQVEYLTDKLKEHEGLLGIQQTADSITFISTGTAQQGENRGLLLGKYAMHEWLERELLYRGLLTDDIRAVFDEAKRQEGR